MPPPPYPSRSPAQHTTAQMYMTHPSLTIQSPERFTFPSPPRHASSGRRSAASEHRLKPAHAESQPPEFLFSPSQRRAFSPVPMVSTPYESRLHHVKTPDAPRFRHTDNRFPGPLRIPPTPRFLDSPSPSPHGSPASSVLDTPNGLHQPFRSPSPTLLPSWRDRGLSQKLPPIRDIPPSSRHNIPQLSSARWNENPYTSPRFRESPSPIPSSPESEGVTLPSHSFLPGSPYYGHPMKSESPPQRRGPARHGDEPRSYRRPPEVDGADGYINKDHFAGKYSLVQETETRHAASSQRRSSVSTLQPARAHTTSESSRYNSYDYNEASQLGSVTRLKSKFGVRKGSRFFCTYVSPLSGERCDIWDKGWTVYATLSRHAETEHGPEELELITRGELSYDQAQVITTREKKQRIEENLAQTELCPDCGTMFSSKRRDSLSRHKQTSACEKAQKRGRPPTRFPKKPKGSSFHASEADSSGETP